MTGLAQLAFPHQATGSLIVLGDGRAVGSALVGQSFSDARYFWGRPSAAGAGYDASASGASNLGPTSAVLLKRVSAEVERLQQPTATGLSRWTSSRPRPPVSTPTSAPRPPSTR